VLTEIDLVIEMLTISNIIMLFLCLLISNDGVSIL